MKQAPLRSSVRAWREKLGIRQQELAMRVGVSRQTLSSVEAAETVPSTTLALALAQALMCRVEDLFVAATEPDHIEAELVSDERASGAAGATSAKARVILGQVGRRWIARPLDGAPAVGPGTPADALAARASTARRTLRVRPLRAIDALHRNLFVAGCDPALGLLGRHLEESFRGPRLHWIELASRKALDELADGRVHVAGLHLLDEATGEHNVPILRRRFGDVPVVVVTLAAWEQGLVYRPGLRRPPRSVADVVRKDLRLVAREPGAGAQELLVRSVAAAGGRMTSIPVAAIARGHHGVAQLVAASVGDFGVATRAAAMAYDLAFVPLAEARFDLAFPADLASDGRIQAMLDCMAGRRFRQDLGALAGYSAAGTGRTMESAA